MLLQKRESLSLGILGSQRPRTIALVNLLEFKTCTGTAVAPARISLSDRSKISPTYLGVLLPLSCRPHSARIAPRGPSPHGFTP